MGPETSDDAGVYRIGPSCALVETSDIITPLVDDPFSFGRIAAANAVSDVYAMGARPVTAMNLVFFSGLLRSGRGSAGDTGRWPECAAGMRRLSGWRAYRGGR